MTYTPGVVVIAYEDIQGIAGVLYSEGSERTERITAYPFKDRTPREAFERAVRRVKEER